MSEGGGERRKGEIKEHVEAEMCGVGRKRISFSNIYPSAGLVFNDIIKFLKA